MWRATATLVLATQAWAHTGEVVGLGSRSASRVGAVSATTSDFSANYYNPAGLAFASGPELTLGASYFASQLSISDQARPIENPFGIIAGGVFPIPLGGFLKDRLTVGLALLVPPKRVVRVIARRSDASFFPLYDNRTQRLVVMPGLGARLHRRVSVGVAFNILAGLSGGVVAHDGATRALSPRIDEQIRTVASVHGGLRLVLPWNLRAALVYRQRFSVPITTVAVTSIAQQPLDLDVDAEGLFTPHQLVAGVAWEAPTRTLLEIDGAYLLWSDYPGPYATVEAGLPLLSPVRTKLPSVEYRDIYAFRAGVEHPLGTPWGAIDLRSGVHFEPSPVPDQPGVSNQLDGSKVSWALGAGIPIGHLSIRIDGHFMIQFVRERTLTKVRADCQPSGSTLTCDRRDPSDSLVDENITTAEFETSNAGYPSISGGGRIVAGGLTLSVQP